MTNFEKIKQMSIDEMARSCMSFFFLTARTALHMSAVLWKNDSTTACIDCTKHWLESEVEE